MNEFDYSQYLPDEMSLDSQFEVDATGGSDLFGYTQETDPYNSGFFGTALDTVEGFGLGIAGAVEGVLEIGNLIPGVDYDIPDNFGLGNAETGMGQFVQGMTSFMLPFLGTGGLATVAQAGKLTRVASLLNKGKGGTYALGKWMSQRSGLTKSTEAWRQGLLVKKLGALEEGKTLTAAMYSGRAAIAGRTPDVVAGMLGGAIVDGLVLDPYDQRVSNAFNDWGVGNAFTEFLAADENDSQAEARFKAVLEGAALGTAFDSVFAGVSALRKFATTLRATGSGEAALKASRKELHEAEITHFVEANKEFVPGLDRETAIHIKMTGLPLNPGDIAWGQSAMDLENQFFQLSEADLPEALKGRIPARELAALNQKSVQEVERLFQTNLDGAIDDDMMIALAKAGRTVAGEFRRMSNDILPKLFPQMEGTTRDDGPLWVAANAILSANNSVVDHTGGAMVSIAAWRAAGRPTDRDSIRRVITSALKTGRSLNEKGKAVKGFKFERAKVDKLVEMLSRADGLTTHELMLHVSDPLQKTGQFAGGYLDNTGVPLDTHMGALIDPEVYPDFSGFYKKMGSAGSTAYRAKIRDLSIRLGWDEGGSELLESIWASVTAVKGLYGYYRGNKIDVKANMRGELISRLWDHTDTFQQLAEDKAFLQTLENMGMDPKIVNDLRTTSGDFAVREVPEDLKGVLDFDDEAMDKAIDRIAQTTQFGVTSGTPLRAVRLLKERVETLKTDLMMKGYDPGLLYRIGAKVEDFYIDSLGKKREVNAGRKGVDTYEYRALDNEGRPAPGSDKGLGGFPDTYRTEVDHKLPTRRYVRDSLPPELQERVGTRVKNGTRVSVPYDTSPAQQIMVNGEVVSADRAVTLRNVDFEVDFSEGVGSKHRLTGDMANPPRGRHAVEGVPIRWNPDYGYMFAGEGGTGRPIRHADEITIVDDVIYARGNVTYWTQRGAEAQGIPTTRQRTETATTRYEQRQVASGRARTFQEGRSNYLVATGRTGGGKTFYEGIQDVRDNSKFGAAVEVKDLDFYEDTYKRNLTLMDPSGEAGVVVTKDGDMVSVFKKPGSKADINDLLAVASKNARTCDCFDIGGKLPDLYSDHGWVPVSRTPFNREFAPEGWDFDLLGEPDIVFMVRDTDGITKGIPIDPDTGGYAAIRDQVPLFDDYGKAADVQKRAHDLLKRKQGAAQPQRYLFQDENYIRGVTEVDEGGRVFARLFEGGNLDTIYHESAHGWRLMHGSRTVPEADRVARGGAYDFELDVLEAKLGVVNGEWTVEAEEQFARWYEAYIYNGEVSRAPGTTDREFDILTVAMERVTQGVREAFEAADKTMPDKIPDEVRTIFDHLVQRGNRIEDVYNNLGDEARAIYERLTIGGVRSGPSQLEKKVSEYEGKLDSIYGKDWRNDPSVLRTGHKAHLSKLRNAVERRRLEGEKIAAASSARSSARAAIKKKMSETLDELDAKYPEGWSEETLEAEERARLTKLKSRQTEMEGDIGFASEVMEGVPGAERGQRPINIRRSIRNTEDVSSGDDARDLLEMMVAEQEDNLLNAKLLDKQMIEEQAFKEYQNLVAASGRGNGQLKLEQVSKLGLGFVAKARAIRQFAADTMESARESYARLEASRKNGAEDMVAKADYLWYLSLMSPLMEQLNHISFLKGFGLADQLNIPMGRLGNRAVNEDDAIRMLQATDAALKAGKTGEGVDDYIARTSAAMREGEMAFISTAVDYQGTRLDVMLEVFYNSILSGPRTQSVNAMSNVLYGTMVHLERRFGRAVLGKLLKQPEVAKGLSAVVTYREMLKGSFKAAKVAMKEGSSQLDPAGARAKFDMQRGVFTGAAKKGTYAERLGFESMPTPLKATLNGLLNFVSVGGYPTKLLGSVDEFFKQMHYRMVVTDELTQKAIKEMGEDPAAAAKYVRDQYDLMARDGNLFNENNLKVQALKEAYSKGLNKSEARRYVQEYMKKNWTSEKGAIAERALQFARKSTFTEELGEGGTNPLSRNVIQPLGKAIQNMTGTVPWLKPIIPFVQVPTNLLTQASEHLLSPLFDGAFKATRLRKVMSESLAEADAALKADREEAIGRLAVSSSLITLVYMKAMSGEITGGGPKDPNAQRLLRDAGWQPYSIRFGDSYYGYQRLDPIASMIGIVADIAEGMNGNPYTDDPEVEGVQALLTSTALAVFRNLSEKSYLSGAIDLAGAIDDPDQYIASYWRNLSGTVVPNLLGQVSQAMDPTLRDVRTTVDNWKNRIPFMGDSLLPKRNFMGEPMGRQTYLGGPLLGLMTPVPASQVTSDLIQGEVTKFGEVISPPQPIKAGGILDLREYDNGQQTAYDRYQELQGEVTLNGRTLREDLEQLISSDRYQIMPDMSMDEGKSPKMQAIRSRVTKYRSRAWKQLLEEFPMLAQNYQITQYNRNARRAGRQEQQLLDLMN